MEVNEYLLAHKDDDNNNTPPLAGNSNDTGSSEENMNKGTLTLNAAWTPANIRYPQNISLLNEARKNWRPSFTVFVNPMVFRCQGVTGGVPEKTILHLPRAENIARERAGRHYTRTVIYKYLLNQQTLIKIVSPSWEERRRATIKKKRKFGHFVFTRPLL